DADTRAFLDIFGVTDGHTLVVLKKHGDTILDYSSEEIGKLWTSVQKVAAALEKAFHTKILSIGINHGEPRGVHHLHVHLMPRYENDQGGIMQQLPTQKRSEEPSEVMKKIKKQL
ncbi:HIT family protein, partial [Candidatus Gottesmanbacteria bacterium]|nr:HIT family protein [Candidatus Gottesmanbacteria bacterium]